MTVRTPLRHTVAMAIKKSDLYSSLWASCDALRGGMEPLAVFTSLPYTVCVLFLMGLTVYLYRVG